jgi:hypothetical protein
MAGIYQRDNIGYGNLLANAIANRINWINRQGDTIRKYGEIASNAVKELGAMGGRLVDAYQAEQESPEARLEKLQAELKEAEAIEAYNRQVEQRKAVNDYINRYNEQVAAGRQNMIDRSAAEMMGYKPNYGIYGYKPLNTGNNLYGMEDYYRHGGI